MATRTIEIEVFISTDRNAKNFFARLQAMVLKTPAFKPLVDKEASPGKQLAPVPPAENRVLVAKFDIDEQHLGGALDELRTIEIDEPIYLLFEGASYRPPDDQHPNGSVVLNMDVPALVSVRKAVTNALARVGITTTWPTTADGELPRLYFLPVPDYFEIGDQAVNAAENAIRNSVAEAVGRQSTHVRLEGWGDWLLASYAANEPFELVDLPDGRRHGDLSPTERDERLLQELSEIFRYLPSASDEVQRTFYKWIDKARVSRAADEEELADGMRALLSSDSILALTDSLWRPLLDKVGQEIQDQDLVGIAAKGADLGVVQYARRFLNVALIGYEDERRSAAQAITPGHPDADLADANEVIMPEAALDVMGAAAQRSAEDLWDPTIDALVQDLDPRAAMLKMLGYRAADLVEATERLERITAADLTVKKIIALEYLLLTTEHLLFNTDEPPAINSPDDERDLGPIREALTEARLTAAAVLAHERPGAGYDRLAALCLQTLAGLQPDNFGPKVGKFATAYLNGRMRRSASRLIGTLRTQASIGLVDRENAAQTAYEAALRSSASELLLELVVATELPFSPAERVRLCTSALAVLWASNDATVNAYPPVLEAAATALDTSDRTAYFAGLNNPQGPSHVWDQALQLRGLAGHSWRPEKYAAKISEAAVFGLWQSVLVREQAGEDVPEEAVLALTVLSDAIDALALPGDRRTGITNIVVNGLVDCARTRQAQGRSDAHYITRAIDRVETAYLPREQGGREQRLSAFTSTALLIVASTSLDIDNLPEDPLRRLMTALGNDAPAASAGLNVAATGIVTWMAQALESAPGDRAAKLIGIQELAAVYPDSAPSAIEFNLMAAAAAIIMAHNPDSRVGPIDDPETLLAKADKLLNKEIAGTTASEYFSERYRVHEIVRPETSPQMIRFLDILQTVVISDEDQRSFGREVHEHARRLTGGLPPVESELLVHQAARAIVHSAQLGLDTEAGEMPEAEAHELLERTLTALPEEAHEAFVTAMTGMSTDVFSYLAALDAQTRLMVVEYLTAPDGPRARISQARAEHTAELRDSAVEATSELERRALNRELAAYEKTTEGLEQFVVEARGDAIVRSAAILANVLNSDELRDEALLDLRAGLLAMPMDVLDYIVALPRERRLPLAETLNNDPVLSDEIFEGRRERAMDMRWQIRDIRRRHARAVTGGVEFPRSEIERAQALEIRLDAYRPGTARLEVFLRRTIEPPDSDNDVPAVDNTLPVEPEDANGEIMRQVVEGLELLRQIPLQPLDEPRWGPTYAVLQSWMDSAQLTQAITAADVPKLLSASSIRVLAEGMASIETMPNGIANRIDHTLRFVSVSGITRTFGAQADPVTETQLASLLTRLAARNLQAGANQPVLREAEWLESISAYADADSQRAAFEALTAMADTLVQTNRASAGPVLRAFLVLAETSDSDVLTAHYLRGATEVFALLAPTDAPSRLLPLWNANKHLDVTPAFEAYGPRLFDALSAAADPDTSALAMMATVLSLRYPAFMARGAEHVTAVDPFAAAAYSMALLAAHGTAISETSTDDDSALSASERVYIATDRALEILQYPFDTLPVRSFALQWGQLLGLQATATGHPQIRDWRGRDFDQSMLRSVNAGAVQAVAQLYENSALRRLPGFPEALHSLTTTLLSTHPDPQSIAAIAIANASPGETQNVQTILRKLGAVTNDDATSTLRATVDLFASRHRADSRAMSKLRRTIDQLPDNMRLPLTETLVMGWFGRARNRRDPALNQIIRAAAAADRRPGGAPTPLKAVALMAAVAKRSLPMGKGFVTTDVLAYVATVFSRSRDPAAPHNPADSAPWKLNAADAAAQLRTTHARKSRQSLPSQPQRPTPTAGPAARSSSRRPGTGKTKRGRPDDPGDASGRQIRRSPRPPIGGPQGAARDRRRDADGATSRQAVRGKRARPLPARRNPAAPRRNPHQTHGGNDNQLETPAQVTSAIAGAPQPRSSASRPAPQVGPAAAPAPSPIPSTSPSRALLLPLSQQPHAPTPPAPASAPSAPGMPAPAPLTRQQAPDGARRDADPLPAHQSRPAQQQARQIRPASPQAPNPANDAKTSGPGHRVLSAIPRTPRNSTTPPGHHAGSAQATTANGPEPRQPAVSTDQTSSAHPPRPPAALMAPGRAASPPESPGKVAQPDHAAQRVDEPSKRVAAEPEPDRKTGSSRATGPAAPSPGAIGH